MTKPPSSSSPLGSGSRPGAQLATPAPAGFIGRYQILERIGEGGMGTLFLARDPAIDRLVAIKLLRRGFDTEPLRERFAREARAAGRLRHPHIVTIFDVGEHDGDPFIAMEFLAGETMAELIRDGARLSLSRRLRLLEEVCDGLAYAHRAGLVHRDVKPANLMVDADGVLKILDFGIVRVTDSGMTQAGVLVGTVNYMSPEQVLGTAIDHRSDIFAVGLVAYELLSGRQAFPGTMKDGLLHRIINVELKPPLSELVPGLDPEVGSIIDQALKKDPADRYQDLARMRNDLARARVRLEQVEEQAASAAAADAGETAVIAQAVTIPGAPLEPPRSSTAGLVADAERALADGNFRAALTLAGRSAAINPHDRTASGVAARAEAALLDRGRNLEGSGAPVRPVSSGAATPSAAPVGTPVPATHVSARATYIAVAVALVALAVAVLAVWQRPPGSGDPPATVASRREPVEATPPSNPAPAPSTPPSTQPPAEPTGTTASAPETPERPTAAPADPPSTPEGRSPSESARDRRGASTPEPTPKPAGRESGRAGDRGRGPGSPAAPPAAVTDPAGARGAPPPVGRPLRAPEEVEAPRKLRGPDPKYPVEALSSGVEGTVGVKVTIDPEGRVVEAEVVDRVRGLDDAAVAAVRQWEFQPTFRGGDPVSVIYTVQVPFHLPPSARPSAPSETTTRPPTTESAPKPLPPPPAPSKPAEAARPENTTGDPRPEIQRTLQAYEAAWTARDPNALRRVQSVSNDDFAEIRQTMTGARSIEVDVTVHGISVDPTGRTATVECTIRRDVRMQIGRASPQERRHRLHLEKRGDTWIITSIN